MALNDIYRITCTQEFNTGGPLCLNVFYYEQITASPNDGAATLLTSFSPGVRDVIRAIQNEAIHWLQILVENIVPSADNAQEDYVSGTVAGSRPGDSLPPYAAWAFRLNRQTTASRHGQKRFVGVSEGDQADGIAEAGLTVAISNVSSVLEQTLGGPVPAFATYSPRIFRAGRPSVTIPEKVIPAVIQDAFPVSSASFVSISTQNTRKFTT